MRQKLRVIKSLLLICFFLFGFAGNAQVNHVVISQIYGGGGNSGAPYNADFVELFNPTGSTVSLNNWSLQYASATGTNWTVKTLSGSIAPGKYFLVRMNNTGANGAALPTPDFSGSTSIDMAGANGKIILANNATGLSNSCPTAASIVDKVSYGTGNCPEGTAAPAGSNILAIFRGGDGCTDTDSNSANFSTGAPAPRNSTSPVVYCGPSKLVITSITPSTPTAGIGFSVTIQSQDASNTARNVFANTSITLSSNGNAGAITGTTTGTITAGANSVTISGVVLPTSGTGVTLTATRTAGDDLSAGTSAAFDVSSSSSPFLMIAGETEHGSVCLGSSGSVVQYTISNTGTVEANTINVVSDNPAFAVSNLSSISVAASGTVTFDVIFTPSVSGNSSANISVTSSTSGSNSPSISISGSGTTAVTPVVVTVAASELDNYAASLNGNVTALGICPSTIEKGFVYAETSVNPDPANGGTGVSTISVDGLETGSFNLPLTNLSPNTSYSYKAYLFDGSVYTYGSVQTFTTLEEADHLAFVSVPVSGMVGVGISSFTVEARRPDNSVDANFAGSVVVSKASGPGNVGGTLEVDAVNGVAAFSDLTFDSAGVYTLSANSGSLASAPSSSITITLTPVVIAAWNFTGVNNGPATAPMTSNDPHLDISSNLNLITRGPNAAANTAGNSFRTQGFQNNGISVANQDYFQTTLKAVNGYSLFLSSITAVYNGTSGFYNAGAGVTSQYAYSLDGENFTLIGSPLASTSLTPPSVDLSGIAALQGVPSDTTVYIRYYASGQTATGGWGYHSPNSNTDGLSFTGNLLCKEPTVFTVTGGGATCDPAGVAVGLSGSESGISYQLKKDGDNVGSPVVGTGSAIDFGTQTVGTYTVVATNAIGGCNMHVDMSGEAVVETASLTTWTGAVNNNWNVAGNWSCNAVPTSSSDVVISSGSPQVDMDAFANTVTVQSGALLTVLSGRSLTVTGAISTTGGNLTIDNNANVIQVNNAVNSGIAKVKRNSSALMRQDYTLWSSPVSGQTLLSFSPQTLTNRFYTYTTSSNLYTMVSDPNATEFALGQGYLIRMPNTHPSTPTIWNGEFNGTLRNGAIAVPLANVGEGQRFNAIGNPYPSPINLAAFVADNAANITGTLYFWRKTNNAASPSYCTWTTLGFTDNGEAEVYDPQGILRTGQGFIVEATESGEEVIFQNTQRSANTANQFFRSASSEVHRIWLNASDEAGSFSQTLVGYAEGATMGVDASIDGRYFNDGDIALYSLIDNEKFAVQGRALPFVPADVVPMGFKAQNAGSYTISISNKDGLFAEGQDIFLRDNATNTVHDLNSGAYAFASEAGTFESRFEVIYQNALSVGNPSLDANAIVVYKKDGKFVISSGSQNLSSVQVFDVLGKSLVQINNIGAAETALSVGASNQVLLFSITTENGNKVVKKMAN